MRRNVFPVNQTLLKCLFDCCNKFEEYPQNVHVAALDATELVHSRHLFIPFPIQQTLTNDARVI